MLNHLLPGISKIAIPRQINQHPRLLVRIQLKLIVSRRRWIQESFPHHRIVVWRRQHHPVRSALQPAKIHSRFNSINLQFTRIEVRRIRIGGACSIIVSRSQPRPRWLGRIPNDHRRGVTGTQNERAIARNGGLQFGGDGFPTLHRRIRQRIHTQIHRSHPSCHRDFSRQNRVVLSHHRRSAHLQLQSHRKQFLTPADRKPPGLRSILRRKWLGRTNHHFIGRINLLHQVNQIRLTRVRCCVRRIQSHCPFSPITHSIIVGIEILYGEPKKRIPSLGGCQSLITRHRRLQIHSRCHGHKACQTRRSLNHIILPLDRRKRQRNT